MPGALVRGLAVLAAGSPVSCGKLLGQAQALAQQVEQLWSVAEENQRLANQWVRVGEVEVAVYWSWQQLGELLRLPAIPAWGGMKGVHSLDEGGSLSSPCFCWRAGMGRVSCWSLFGNL